MARDINPTIVIYDNVGASRGSYGMLTDSLWSIGTYVGSEADYPDTQTVLDRSLGGSWSFYTDDTKGTSYYNGPMALISDGCEAADNAMNCADVCHDTSLLFASWRRLWTCLTLASLALGDSMFTLDEQYRQEIDEVLSQMNVSDISRFDAMGVLNATYECATASCEQSEVGPCSISYPTDPNFITDNGTRWDMMYEALLPLCENINVEINVDIAGPGVVISYIIQNMVVLYAWVLIRAITARVTLNSLAAPFLRLRHKKEPLTDRHPRLASALEGISETNLAHSTSAFMVEFQEAQCFFLMAIEIGLLYANTQPASFVGANTWQSLLVNRDRIKLLSTAGTWPITLTQMNLRRIKLDSYYTLALSTVTMALAIVASQIAMDPDGDRAYEMFRGEQTLEKCGGNTSMRTFCVGNDYGSTITLSPDTIVILPTLVILWWSRLWSQLTRADRFREWVKGLSHRGQVVLRVTALVFSKIRTLALFLFEAWLVGFSIFSLYLLFLDLQSLWDHTSQSVEWNVGQVIAMLVMAPALAKYLYLLTLGVEEGFRVRISNAFTVRKKSAAMEIYGDQDAPSTNKIEDDFEETASNFNGQDPVKRGMIRRRTTL